MIVTIQRWIQSIFRHIILGVVIILFIIVYQVGDPSIPITLPAYVWVIILGAVLYNYDVLYGRLIHDAIQDIRLILKLIAAFLAPEG